MAGVDVGGGKGKRRSLDSEINMIPFIDLLMVTISFLLITAVWTHMSRLDATARVPDPNADGPRTPVENEKVLHVEMRQPDRFLLVWKSGTQVVSSVEVPRRDDVQDDKGHKLVRYRDLATKIEEEWKTHGSHRDTSDRALDRAVLHTDNETPYTFLIAAMDAIHQAHRAYTDPRTGKTSDVSAFDITFATN